MHLVDEIPDGGKILAQKAVDVLPGDTPETLQRRVMVEAEWVLLPRAVEDAVRPDHKGERSNEPDPSIPALKRLSGPRHPAWAPRRTAAR